ncbi:MAG: four helix bundle protein [Calditrichaeota bacterium]|nr:MAG: four helix bundle protein [Calditrichota bacterium]
MRDFRTLSIWQEGIVIVKHVYKVAQYLPPEEKYGLRSQITRCAVSIPSNIAEGCSRSSQIDFKRFLEIALGSAFELETQLIIMEELSIIAGDLNNIKLQLNKEQKMINSLISKLKANS